MHHVAEGHCFSHAMFQRSMMELYAKRIADMIFGIGMVLGVSNAIGSTEGVANPPNDQQEARDDEHPSVDIDLFPSNTEQPATDVAEPSMQVAGPSKHASGAFASDFAEGWGGRGGGGDVAAAMVEVRGDSRGDPTGTVACGKSDGFGRHPTFCMLSGVLAAVMP
ncbi:hypothetical protein E2562_025873 [Oryza meyeriana var. granulata]|uniref:Uncharacterized protein n=1 Tax=Oryza meyeriana var. granulata TaxID=110450 RepID=A0A6G1D7W2_9ORYZ|nr:hypothetical protein E2562_025873 [Oryza meyeriana var. granulata]